MKMDPTKSAMPITRWKIRCFGPARSGCIFDISHLAIKKDQVTRLDVAQKKKIIEVIVKTREGVAIAGNRDKATPVGVQVWRVGD
jgi:hypothetical protein